MSRQYDIGRRTAVADIGATRLYHEVCGSGPAILLITGGSGDAEEWRQTAAALAEEFTVVTYDRRGFSRSPPPEDWTVTSVSEQADDAAGLLSTLDLAPAVVVGHSSGGSIACSLVERHPRLVRHAVIYEPPLFAVVPHGEEILSGYRSAIEQAMLEGGPRRAMEAFLRHTVGDEMIEKWFELVDPAEWYRVLDNGSVLFQMELPWVSRYVPDRDLMRTSGVPLTVTVGEENRDTWFGVAATWLADGTGAERAELRGGHVGFITHPREFIELVTRIARRKN